MHARTHEVREGHTAKRVRAFARGGRRFRANGAARTEGSCQRERSTGMEEKGRARRELGEGGGGKRERERERGMVDGGRRVGNGGIAGGEGKWRTRFLNSWY